MKKLILEEIRVESFSTGEAQDQGTVVAYATSGPVVCISCGCGSAASYFEPPRCCIV